MMSSRLPIAVLFVLAGVSSWARAVEPAAPPEFAMSAERAPDARIEPLHFLYGYGRQSEPLYAFDATTRADWQRWHGELHRRFVETLGVPPFDDFPLRVTAGPVDKLDGYTRHAFTIETAPELFVPAFLLVPEGLTGPRPAILCSHGHGYGMNDLVGLGENGKPRGEGADPTDEKARDPGYEKDFGLQAVRAGFVTLVFDQMGFGRRRDIDFNKKFNLWNNCEHPSKVAIHEGLSMSGIRVFDARRMIDFLQSRPEVKADAIGMVGISGGGLVTQFTSAVDDRIKAACVSGFLNRFDACILGLNHCIDNYVPGLGVVADNDDVACLIAPRPLLIEAGTKDPIFPIEATRAAIAKLERVYKLLDVPDRLDTDIFEKGHEISGAKMWTFFARHLGDPKAE